MRIVIITGDGPEHHYVTNTLTEHFSVHTILVCDPPARRSWKTLLRQSLPVFVSKAARVAFLRAIGDAKTRREALRQIFGERGAGFSKPELIQRVGKPKDGQLERTVDHLSPDILAIYGTGIIPNGVLEKAASVALNMHTGISPYYRGVSCATWPILDEVPEMIGATVHKCTADVDGGEIYFRGQASLDTDESLHGVFAKAVMVGAAGYTNVVQKALDGALTGEAQNLSLGKEYHGQMIGLWSELKTRRALRKLKRHNKLATVGGAFKTQGSSIE